MKPTEANNMENRKKFIVIGCGIALVLVIAVVGVILALTYGKDEKNPDDVDTLASNSSQITQGDDDEITSDIGDVSEISNTASEETQADVTRPSVKDDNTASVSSVSSDLVSGLPSENPGNSIPDVTVSSKNSTTGNGFLDFILKPLLSRKYDEFRIFNSLPDNYLSVAKSAKTLLRNDLFVESDTYEQPLDYQREVIQRNKYVFQNVGTEVTDPTQAYFVKYEGNPVLWGQNLYTPWIVKKDDTWFVYYGGYGDESSNGADTTFLATTKDPELRSGWTLHGAVVTPQGQYLCAQDPAVAIHNGKFVMVYSYTKIIYGKGIDWIGVATSDDGIHWTPDTPDSKEYEITITNRERATYDFIGRPSLYYNESKSRWEMYVDGELEGETPGMYVLYSTEDIPMNWTYEGLVMQTCGESCLAVINGTYYLGYRYTKESWPTRMRIAKSTDGKTFTDSTYTILGEKLSNGQTNNISMMAFAVEDNQIKALLYGRSLEGWSHKVSLAYPQKYIEAWRGGEKIDAEPTATSSTTQVYSSEGSSSPVTKVRSYDAYGKPASFETTLQLRPNMAYYFGELPSKPSKPVLTAPYNQSTKQNWGPQFSWQPSKGAQRYKLMVSENSDFNTNALYVNSLFVEEYRPINALKEGVTYYWKVIAYNAYGSAESDVNSFTVVGKSELIGEYLSATPTKVTATEDASGEDTRANLSDGPYYTYWTGIMEDDKNPNFVMDYGKLYQFSRFYYIPRVDGVGVPTTFTIQYSLDGENYVTIRSDDYITSSAVSGGVETKYCTLIKPVNARFVRFTVEESLGTQAGVAEFRAQVLR